MDFCNDFMFETAVTIDFVSNVLVSSPILTLTSPSQRQTIIMFNDYLWFELLCHDFLFQLIEAEWRIYASANYTIIGSDNGL